MRIIPIDKIKEGMVLGERVCDEFGRTLVGEGVELLSKHIEMLRSYGIRDIYIQQSDDEAFDEDKPVNPECLDEAEKKLDHIFVLVQSGNEVMDEIRRCAVTSLARKLESEK